MQIKLSVGYYRSLKSFVKNNKINAENIKKALSLFRENPHHPSLNLEKLKGSHIWTIRIDKGNRIFFSWIDKTIVLFLDVGKHDKYRRY
jgi:mRNA-degrading endonuclease YafQ of YafQ-DinJ toxin-antitoxin module